MEDRFAAGGGVVCAAAALAASFLPWTDAVALAGVPNPVGAALASVVLAAFGLRTRDVDRRLSVLAGAGAALYVGLAFVALVAPAAVGDGSVADVGVGLPVGAGAALFALGLAGADRVGLDRDAVLSRLGGGATAFATGLAGLLVGGLTAAVVQSIGRGLGLAPLLTSGLANAAFAVALGFVAMAVVLVRGDDVRFFDVRWPTAREWAYAVGGTFAMLGVLVALNVAVSVFGLPSAQHSILEQARENPRLLLVLIALSWIAIGPGEELLARNVVQKYLYADFSRAGAVLVGCLVFATMHVFAYAGSGPAALAVSLTNLFLVSLVLGIVYERTDNVVVAAVTHGTYDAVQFGLAYVAITTGVA